MTWKKSKPSCFKDVSATNYQGLERYFLGEKLFHHLHCCFLTGSWQRWTVLDMDELWLPADCCHLRAPLVAHLTSFLGVVISATNKLHLAHLQKLH